MSNEHGHEHTDTDPVEEIAERRRRAADIGTTGRERDSSYTVNPGFAAREGTSADPAEVEVDYVEEPGVGGVSQDAQDVHTSSSPSDEPRP
ncbi:hypothetical protein [Ornithinimicrobium sediminis]|uniref:hypothetical protein n=1 Tax=Ornithinimicrobium sediminis TaxID=2904603 RepID=UPI001E5745A1|nr:hypothetical protein [Ornithinimicrobium sediminis]MCE0486795.1 hypothetical protein [Ornithinimicrobium sediminis]